LEVVLLTHVNHFVGPGTLPVLLRQGMRPFCHDAGFIDPQVASDFEETNPGAIALRAQTPPDLGDELRGHGVAIDTFISNDVFPNTPLPIEDVSIETLRDSFEALLCFPFQMAQQLLPAMKQRRKGRFVFITSARNLQPETGFSVATSIRAGTTAFALALAREAAPYGIQVNVMAPNYLYSEDYYPRARFIDDPAGREEIAAIVPMGRLGMPEEAGELVAFLASGQAPFMTGQVVNFTGGWP
jgi:NAD(P)-dependent dehydrogenase (short-subunit alcohol dehydrogenase family)